MCVCVRAFLEQKVPSAVTIASLMPPTITKTMAPWTASLTTIAGVAKSVITLPVAPVLQRQSLPLPTHRSLHAMHTLLLLLLLLVVVVPPPLGFTLQCHRVLLLWLWLCTGACECVQVTREFRDSDAREAFGARSDLQTLVARQQQRFVNLQLCWGGRERERGDKEEGEHAHVGVCVFLCVCAGVCWCVCACVLSVSAPGCVTLCLHCQDVDANMRSGQLVLCKQSALHDLVVVGQLSLLPLLKHLNTGHQQSVQTSE